jgi:uncharacterized RDD family membrane protein YckC
MSRTDEFLAIDTPENVIFDYEVVGIGTRFIAALIDHLILVLVLVIINLASLIVQGMSSALEAWAWALRSVLTFLTIWGYFLFFEGRWNGQTPGKRWAKIRVIRRDGTPVSMVEVAIRNLVRVVDFLPLGYGVGLVTMFIHPQSARLGDLAAGTLVVRESSELSLAQLGERPSVRSFLAGSAEAQVAPWPVERLTADDLQLAIDFLQRRQQLTNANALALTIVKRLLTRLELPETTVSEAEAPAVLAALVNRSRQLTK